MKVLVLFDLIPETQCRCIVDMSEEEFLFFSKAHNYFTNGSEWCDEKVEIVNIISNAFAEDENQLKYCETDMQREYFGKFVNDHNNQDLSEVSKLIYCGFIL